MAVPCYGGEGIGIGDLPKLKMRGVSLKSLTIDATVERKEWRASHRDGNPMGSSWFSLAGRRHSDMFDVIVALQRVF
jgi:hypothetical protein